VEYWKIRPSAQGSEFGFVALVPRESLPVNWRQRIWICSTRTTGIPSRELATAIGLRHGKGFPWYEWDKIKQQTINRGDETQQIK
jgi:hypothetical protein